ncbi:CoB--CoM heterodisulfide reductase iron-sulfur subunit A family protein [Desulfovibrio sp. JC010]|uniref:CoB--CoM heterodisulfide reductase iron-sulfur subunit A family protein n=1 Tax=Desulfovibrio sp. JC010 TaxID=2593641 RepID=UPI0013D5CD18|nr:FAD-dependent oxidoreductase [Desulfovibrio sp. JC010]NDV25878.1 CoB--CoM heterodisulfide reductase iron-sulfur subunit A family protein [Desulfovibrio sp. JC010]
MSNSILVVGGGFSGITAALEAAEVGHEVFIVEKAPYLGGRVMQLNKYFPKLCPPSCGLEIQFQRIKNNKNVKFFTLAEVESISGSKGEYEVKVRIKPRYVGPGSVELNDVIEKLTNNITDEFEYKLCDRKALYMDVPFAFPARYVLEKENCTDEDLKLLEGVDVIDLKEEEKVITLNVGSIVYATGWKPYDVTKLSNLGAGTVKNCISNMAMERLAAPSGPTDGQIVRPSDGAQPKNIAFVQCAGSRDENHLNFCSYICCMASLKQAAYVREQYPDAKVTIYYIDLRTPGRYDKFAKRILSDDKINAVKGKVAEVVEESGSGNVLVTVEDAESGIKSQNEHDLLVLATGMQPSLAGTPVPSGVQVDDQGFIVGGEEQGIFAAGCAKQPLDVMKTAQSGTAAALKAIQTVIGR